MAEDITIEMLEGAAYRIYVTLRDDTKALLDTALYDVYGGMSNGKDKVIADVVPHGQGRVLVTLPPGAYSGFSWQYQVCVREKSTGYEWIAVQGEANILERVLEVQDACISPPDADVTAVLSPQQLVCEATLVAWNGDVLAGGGSTELPGADAVRAMLDARLTVRVETAEVLGNPAAAGVALFDCCTVQLAAVRGGVLSGVRLPACAGGTGGAARLLRVQVQAEDGAWLDAASSAATPVQEAGADCDFALAVPLALREGAALRLLWVDTSGAAAEVALPVVPDSGVDELVAAADGTFMQASPCLSLLWQQAKEKYATAEEAAASAATAVEAAMQDPVYRLYGGDDNRGVVQVVEWAAGALPAGRVDRLVLRHAGVTHNSAVLGTFCAVLLAYDEAADKEQWLGTSAPQPVTAAGVIYDLPFGFPWGAVVPAGMKLRLAFIDATAAVYGEADAAAARQALYLRLTVGANNTRVFFGSWYEWGPYCAATVQVRHNAATREHVQHVADGVCMVAAETRNGVQTCLYLLAAGSAAAAAYTGGAAGLGFIVRSGGSITARGCKPLAALLADHAGDFDV